MSLIKVAKSIDENEETFYSEDQRELFKEDVITKNGLEIYGTIKKLLFINEIDGFSVYIAKSDNKDIIIRTNSTTIFQQGTPIKAIGEWVEYKDKKQFQALGIFEQMPNNLEGILLWMKKNKNQLPGIGEKTFLSLSNFFGNELVEHMSNIDILSQVIPRVKAELIADAWKSKTNIMLFEMELRNSDIKPNQIVKIIDFYKNDDDKNDDDNDGEKDFSDEKLNVIYETIKKNPWKLMEVEGVGFSSCDNIARRYNLDMSCKNRIQAGIMSIINGFAQKAGDCGIEPTTLLDKSISLLTLTHEQIEPVYNALFEENALRYIKDVNLIYPENLYQAEQSIVKNISRIMNTWFYRNKNDVINEIERAEKELGVKLDRDGGQLEAAILALSSPICIITGGPGTGKSTTQNVIVRVLELRGKTVSLTAFMGKAAKRLGEVTGKENTSTIHRLLKSIPNKGFIYNEKKKLKSNVIIIDEFSTVDLLLTAALFKAIEDGSQIIIVGDVNQLPSVTPGQVLRDMIDSKAIPVAYLTKIHRQVNGSEISTATTRINKGEFPIKPNEKLNGFSFIETPDQSIKNILCSTIRDKIAMNGYDPVEDVQILMGYKVGQLGTSKINDFIKSILNPHEDNPDSVEINERYFSKKDRVMQLKNDKENKVFNGEVDYITDVHDSENNAEKYFTVGFEEKNVQYFYKNLDNISLSYAGTIHKSQGSEYPFIIIIVPQSHSNMLTRNLLYTAVSRGKMDVVIIGNKNAIQTAISKNDIGRKTALKTLLYNMNIKKNNSQEIQNISNSPRV
jgi:exodeoxyribonuclease V alpha subunit